MFHGEWQGWARKLVNHTSSLFFLSLWKREKRFTFLLLLFIYSFIHFFFFIYLWIHSFIHFFFFFSLAPSVFYLPQTVKIEKNIQLFFWLNSFAYYLLLDLLFICLFTYLFICLFTCLFFLLKLICCVFFFSLIYFFRYLSIYGFIHLFIISSFLLYLLWIHLFLYTLIHSFIYLFCIHLFIYFFFFFSLTPSVFYCQFFPHLNNSPYSLDLGTLLVSWFLRLSVLFLSIPKCGVVHAGLILLFWRVWSRAGCQRLASVSKVDLLCMRIPHLSDSGFSGRFLYVFVCRLGILLSCRFFVCFFFFCRVVEQFLYSSVCTSPRLRLYGPFRCLLYLYPLPVGYRNWKSSQGHFVSLSFTPSLFRSSSIPCKDKIYFVFFFLSFLSFLPSFLLFFLSFRPCLKTCQKKNKKLHLSFFSVLNFSAWSISNVLIFFSLLLIFFFNWILSF